MKREVLLGVVAALFVASVVGVALGFSVSKEKEITETRLTYKLTGSFDHQAYEKSVPEAGSSSKYFSF